jgi:hypothetical protein
MGGEDPHLTVPKSLHRPIIILTISGPSASLNLLPAQVDHDEKLDGPWATQSVESPDVRAWSRGKMTPLAIEISPVPRSLYT